MAISSIKLLANLSNQRLIFPFYHAVSNQAPGHLKHLYLVRSERQFEKDLDQLLKNFTPVSLSDIYQAITKNAKLPKYAFHITFDDGLREFGEIAWPLLKRKGIPASLFINPDFVDNKAMFYRLKASILIDFVQRNSNSKIVAEAGKVLGEIMTQVTNLEFFIDNVSYQQKKVLDDLAEYFAIDFTQFLHEKQPYLTLAELEMLEKEGVCIGAHSMDHPKYFDLNEETQKIQTQESMQWVTKNLNPQLKVFSFPFTDYGLTTGFFNYLYHENGANVDLSFGTAGIKKEQLDLHLQRIPVEDNEKSINFQLLKQYLYYIAKAPFFKNTIRRRL